MQPQTQPHFPADPSVDTGASSATFSSCGKGTTRNRTMSSEPEIREGLVHIAWVEKKPIPFSFLVNTNSLYPFPSITADSQPWNVSYTGIVRVSLSLHSFSLTNIFHFLQNNGGVDKIFHPQMLFPVQWNAATEELFAHHYKRNTVLNLGL